MYEQHFGLDRSPFKITPDTSLFFRGSKRGDILGALLYVVHRGEGIVKVVGEVGSGKTILCRMLQQELPKTVEIIYIANPSVSAEDILFVIAHELGLPVSKQASKHEVMNMLQDYLVQRHTENKQVLLFVEEAQGMPLETLEEIRLLSNLETNQSKLLQIILFGQPELDENLGLKSIRQLRERITHSFQLLPLTKDEIHQYLNFRMREVGYTGPELITIEVAKKIHQYSAGLPRRINVIADKVLLSAFSESTHGLTINHVIAAADDSGFVSEQSNRKKTPLILFIVSLVIILLAITLYQTRAQWLHLINPQMASAQSINPSIKTPIDARVETENPLIGQPQKASGTVTVATNTAEKISTSHLDGNMPILKKQNGSQKNQTESVASNINQAKNTKFEDKQITSTQNTPVVKIDQPFEGSDEQWLNMKIEKSRQWLTNADKDNVSIQIMIRNKDAAKLLVRFLKNESKLDLNRVYLYEMQSETANYYHVFYGEFDSVTKGRQVITQLPKSIKNNKPYLRWIHNMQADLLR